MHTSARARSLAAQLILLLYFELCVLVPLGGWNDQPGMQRPGSPGNLILGAAIAGPQLLLLIATVRRVRPLLWVGLLGDSVWLALHATSLWLPYVRGASPEYARMYARVFGRTTKLLPNFANHLAPDAMHIFIDVLLLGVLVTLVQYLNGIGWLPRRQASTASSRTVL